MRWSRENDFDADVARASARWNVPMPLIKAVIAVESGFNPNAINANDPGKAWGLMQMIPATAAGLGYTGAMSRLLIDTTLAIDLGAELLGQNLRRSGVVADSVSAYNGGFRPTLGFGATKNGRYGNQVYVDAVLDALRYFEKQSPAGGGEPAGATPFPPAVGGASTTSPPPKETVTPVQVDPKVIIEVLKELAGFVHAQASDPEHDRQRIARLNLAHDLAATGNNEPIASLGNMVARDYIEYIISDVEIPGGGTSSGSKIARAYARLVKLRLQAGE